MIVNGCGRDLVLRWLPEVAVQFRLQCRREDGRRLGPVWNHHAKPERAISGEGKIWQQKPRTGHHEVVDVGLKSLDLIDELGADSIYLDYLGR